MPAARFFVIFLCCLVLLLFGGKAANGDKTLDGSTFFLMREVRLLGLFRKRQKVREQNKFLLGSNLPSIQIKQGWGVFWRAAPDDLNLNCWVVDFSVHSGSRIDCYFLVWICAWLLFWCLIFVTFVVGMMRVIERRERGKKASYLWRLFFRFVNTLLSQPICRIKKKP